MITRHANVNPGAEQGPWVRPIRGYDTAPILVICDAQSEVALREKLPMEKEQMKWMAEMLQGTGLDRYDFCFVALSPPVPREVQGLDAQTWKFIEPHAAGISEIIKQRKPKIVVPFGAYASRAVTGRPTKITKVRGVPRMIDGLPPVMSMYSPWYVRRKPENMNVFAADLDTLGRIKSVDFNPLAIAAPEVDYRWVSDLSELINARPQIVALDTETTGLTWWKADTRVLVAQFTMRPGQTFLAPIHPQYFAKVFPGLDMTVLRKLRRQVKQICEDVAIRKIGHNIKFDHQMLRKEGMEVRGWLHDTQLMMFFVDENILEKSLDEGTRLFVPEMSGYADQFNQHIDKSKMMDVPPEDVVDLDGKIIQYGMRMYAGGDTDADFRLAQRLDRIMRRDTRSYNCYRKIQFPALLAFAKTVERYGILINKDALRSLSQEVKEFLATTKAELNAMIPVALRKDYLQRGEDMDLGRPAVLMDILFGSRDKDGKLRNLGFKLKPKVFTKSTANLQDKTKRVPSVSTKDHLPYFKDEPGVAGEFVNKLIEYVQSLKISTTYLGNEVNLNAKGVDTGPTGFWQYIAPDGAIFPSYKLHATVTGRSASENPNGQNIPQRGRFAKSYKKIFRARPGYKLISADLSQIELRLAAWEANEPTMMKIYRSGGDIHMATAEIAAGVPEGFYAKHAKDQRILVEEHVANQFKGSGDYLKNLSPGERKTATVAKFVKYQRQKAKAVNFGYIYGMSAAGFATYAKTQYGVDVTLEEAEVMRNRYFAKFSKLPAWHEKRKSEARRSGVVRSLHGAVRHLPSINSTDRGIMAEAERQAVNSPIQRFGSDLGLMALWRFTFQADPERFRILGFVHDALYVEVKNGDEIEGLKSLIWAMQNLPLGEYFNLRSPLPIVAEGDIGITQGDMYELGDLPSEDKAPEWLKEVGLDALKTLVPEKPVWWDDDWRRVETRYHLRNTLNA